MRKLVDRPIDPCTWFWQRVFMGWYLTSEKYENFQKFWAFGFLFEEKFWAFGFWAIFSPCPEQKPKSSKYILWYFKQIQMEMWMEVSSVDFSSSGERGESQLCASGVGLSFPSKCFTWAQLTRIHYSASCASILYNWGIMTQAQRNLHDIVCINLFTSEASWCGYIWVSFSASTFPPSPAHIV